MVPLKGPSKSSTLTILSPLAESTKHLNFLADSLLMIHMRKQTLIWNKNKCGSPGLSKYRPNKVHENIIKLIY